MFRYLLYLCLVIGIGCANAQPAQEHTWVLDQEALFTPEQIQQLDALVKEHERSTTNEIAIITTASIEPHERMLDYAVKIGNTHGVGKKEKDNGVVVIVSRTLRETFIATGHGTEQILSDEQVQQIVDSLMIPHFKEDRYFEGTYAGTQAVVRLLEER
jgi:uncharacterized protein